MAPLGDTLPGPPDGPLLLQMINTTSNQDACQGTSVQVTVGANSPLSPGGPSGPGPGGPTSPATFAVTKSATPSTVYAGSSTPITYTLTALNTGGAPGTVFLTDTAPPGTTLVSGSNSCPAVTAPTTCSTSVVGSTVHWTIANVAAGASAAVTFAATVNAGVATGVISNTAGWSGSGCGAPITCPTNTTSTNVTAPIPLLITASDTTTSYGAVPVVTPTYTPSITGALATPPTCTSTVTASSGVGTKAGANTCSGASDPAYVITYTPGTAVVDPAPLTVTASSGTMTYGGTAPTITCAVTGFVDGQTESVLTGSPKGSTTATSSSPVGSYPSTCTGAAAPNYTFTVVPGTVTVGTAALTITASGGSFPLGGIPPVITAGYSGFVNGDERDFADHGAHLLDDGDDLQCAGCVPVHLQRCDRPELHHHRRAGHGHGDPGGHEHVHADRHRDAVELIPHDEGEHHLAARLHGSTAVGRMAHRGGGAGVGLRSRRARPLAPAYSEARRQIGHDAQGAGRDSSVFALPRRRTTGRPNRENLEPVDPPRRWRRETARAVAITPGPSQRPLLSLGRLVGWYEHAAENARGGLGGRGRTSPNPGVGSLAVAPRLKA